MAKPDEIFSDWASPGYAELAKNGRSERLHLAPLYRPRIRARGHQRARRPRPEPLDGPPYGPSVRPGPSYGRDATREGELLSSSVRNRSRAVTSFGRPVPSLAAQQLRKTQFKISVAQISLHKWHSKAVPLTGGSSLSARIRST